MSTLQTNTAQIRQALKNAFDDVGLDALCFDYFPSIKDKFSIGMRQDEKIGLLLASCRRSPSGFRRLLDAVREEYKFSGGKRDELIPLTRVLEADMNRLQIGEEGQEESRRSAMISPESSYLPPDRSKGASQMSFKQKIKLLNALLACPTMSDRESRNAVVDELPNYIKENIQRDNRARFDVNNLIKICLNYASGIEELIEIVRFYEGPSISMQKLNDLMG